MGGILPSLPRSGAKGVKGVKGVKKFRAGGMTLFPWPHGAAATPRRGPVRRDASPGGVAIVLGAGLDTPNRVVIRRGRPLSDCGGRGLFRPGSRVQSGNSSDTSPCQTGMGEKTAHPPGNRPISPSGS